MTHLKALLGHRELLYFLALRDIKARYKQTVLGLSWALLQPFALMLVLTVVFSVFAKVPSDGIPYPVFAYCALLPWTFLSAVVNRGVASLLSNQSLIKKVYFPREILVFAVILAAALDFLVGAFLLAGLLWYFKVAVTVHILMVLPIFLVQLCFLLGVALILSVSNVFYRDIGHLIPLFLQAWMFLSPVVYPVTLVPQHLRALYALNPMAGVLEGYRSVLLRGTAPDLSMLGLAACVGVATLMGGIVYFRRLEPRLADVI